MDWATFWAMFSKIDLVTLIGNFSLRPTLFFEMMSSKLKEVKSKKLLQYQTANAEGMGAKVLQSLGFKFQI
jgi:hypothetical protein